VNAETIRVCRCGRGFDRETWRALKFVGERPDERGSTIELRNCACHSTLSIHPSRYLITTLRDREPGQRAAALYLNECRERRRRRLVGVLGVLVAVLVGALI
jgi:hypothetical protein